MTEYVSIEEFNALKNAYIDTVGLLANALKRITQLEEALFSQDEDGEIIRDSEDKPILSIELTQSNNVEMPKEEKEENILIQNTSLTKKATALKEYLKEKVKPNWSGKTVIENEGIYEFFYEKIEESLRWPEKLKGYRTAKKEIIERAVEMYPNELELIKNKSGNKITGLALKPSVKRRDTYA